MVGTKQTRSQPRALSSLNRDWCTIPTGEVPLESLHLFSQRDGSPIDQAGNRESEINHTKVRVSMRSRIHFDESILDDESSPHNNVTCVNAENTFTLRSALLCCPQHRASNEAETPQLSARDKTMFEVSVSRVPTF